jgi:hypothetical protein
LDTDRTILLHQAEASQRPDDSNLLLIGDSSCLMDVVAAELGRDLPGCRARNLGSLSYLDLEAFGTILRHYLVAHPGQVRAVVLLMHAEALRRPGGTEYHQQVLDSFYRATDFCGPSLPRISCALGVEILRGRLLSRAVPQPLSGAFGRTYGFTHDLWEYLATHRGSAIDPNNFDPTQISGSIEFRLARSLEPASRQFRALIPENMKLIVGITPLPQSAAPPGFAKRHQDFLRTWSQWLEADAALAELPAVWPDARFASAAHLNEEGARVYTQQLAESLSRRLGGTRW